MTCTSDYWPRLIKTIDDIPASFKVFFEKIYVPQTPFPYTVLTFPDKWDSGKTISKLICLFDDRIYIAEKKNKEIISSCFMINQITYTEMGILLLHSWLKIQGKINEKLTSITVDFNTVVQDFFKPIIEKIRLHIHHIEPSESSIFELQREQKKFDYLSRVNYKYMNFGKQSLLPVCKVKHILLQPDIQVKFMRYFTRTLSLVHQTILTDKELIIIKDVGNKRMSKQSRYGGIWRYIPLDNIEKMELSCDPETGFYTLKINLTEDEIISSLFSADSKPELDLLQSEFEKSKSVPEEMNVV